MDDKLIVNTENGIIEYDILMSFSCNENGKNYVVYTEHKKNDLNQEQIYVSSVKDDKLESIYSMEEQKFVNDVLSNIR